MFPKFNWLESDDGFLVSAATILANYSGDQGELNARQKELQNSFNTRFKKIALHRPSGQNGEIDFERARAGRIDRSILRANQLVEFQKSWIYLCGQDLSGNSCRARLLLGEIFSTFQLTSLQVILGNFVNFDRRRDNPGSNSDSIPDMSTLKPKTQNGRTLPEPCPQFHVQPVAGGRARRYIGNAHFFRQACGPRAEADASVGT